MKESPSTQAMNCWEFKNCPRNVRDGCVVYKTDSGRECWLLMSHKTGCPNSKGLKCFDCEWYKANNKKNVRLPEPGRLPPHFYMEGAQDKTPQKMATPKTAPEGLCFSHCRLC